MRLRRLAAALSTFLLVTLAACGDSEPAIPKVDVTIGEQSVSLAPTVYCVSGEATLGDEKSGTQAMQVSADQQITIVVPEEVAEKDWSIQIWSVIDSGGKAVPGTQTGDIPVGTDTSYAFSTSDSAIDRYFIMVVIPEDPKCNAVASAGIWTLMISRV